MACASVTFERKNPGDTNFANFANFVTLERPPRRNCPEKKLTKLTVRRVFEGDSDGAVEGDTAVLAMPPAWLVFDNGAGCRIRTRDLRFTKPLLYQLS